MGTIPLIGGVIPRSKSERQFSKDSIDSTATSYTMNDCESEMYYDGSKFKSNMRQFVKTFKQQQELKRIRKIEGLPVSGLTRSYSLPPPGTSQSQRMRDVASQEPSRAPSKIKPRWAGSANSGQRVTSNRPISSGNRYNDSSGEVSDAKE